MTVITAVNVVSATTIDVYNNVNSTMSGPATAGIQASSSVAATCAISTAQLSHQAPGSAANGNFMVRLVNSWYHTPAGTETGFSFETEWS